MRADNSGELMAEILKEERDTVCTEMERFKFLLLKVSSCSVPYLQDRSDELSQR